MDAKLNTQNRVSPTRAINVPNFSAGRDAMYSAHRSGIEELSKAYSKVGDAVAYCGKALWDYDQANVKKQYAADEAILKTKYAEQYAALSNRISKQEFGSTGEMKAAFEAGAQEIDERIADGIQNGFDNGDGTTFRFRNADRFQEPLRQLGEVQKATAMNTAVQSWIVEEDNRTQRAFDTQLNTAVMLGDTDSVRKICSQLTGFYPANKDVYKAKEAFALATIANRTAATIQGNAQKKAVAEADMELKLALEKRDFDAAAAALDKKVRLGAITQKHKDAELEKEKLTASREKAEKDEKEAGKKAQVLLKTQEEETRITTEEYIRGAFTGGNKAKMDELVGIEQSEEDIKFELNEAKITFDTTFDEKTEQAVLDFEQQLKSIPNLSENDKWTNIANFRTMREKVKADAWARFKAQIEKEKLENTIRFKNGLVKMAYDGTSIPELSANPVYKNISLDDTFADDAYKFAPSNSDETEEGKRALLAAYLRIGRLNPNTPDFQRRLHIALSELRLSGNGVSRESYAGVYAFAVARIEGKEKHKLDSIESGMVLSHISDRLCKYFGVNKKKIGGKVSDVWSAINDSELSGDACDELNNFLRSLADIAPDITTANALADKFIDTVYVKDQEEKANARAEKLLQWKPIKGIRRPAKAQVAK